MKNKEEVKPKTE